MAIQKISNAVIADDAVSADNIATGAITVADIPDGEITTAKIGDDQITNAKIAPDAVTSTEIANGSVTYDQIANGTIITSKIADGQITSAKMASNITLNASDYILNGISTNITDTAVDVFIYDTSKDSDGGAWRERTQDTSWYNETLNTATRGSRREFPAVAVIVAEINQVTIYDGDDPSLPMWMVFEHGGSWSSTANLIMTTSSDVTSISILNGTLCVCNDSGYGLVIINFIEDKSEVITATSHILYRAVISQRNSGAGFSSNIDSNRIVNSTTNDVAMTVLPNASIDSATGLPIPTIAVATDGGVSVIKDDGTVVDINPDTGGQYAPVARVEFIGTTEIAYASRNTAVWYLSPIPSSDTTYSAYNDKTGNVDRVIYGGSYSSPEIVIADDNDSGYSAREIATQNREEINFQTRRGLNKVYRDTADESEGLVAVIKHDYNTGWMPGDIKLATLSDTDDTDVTGPSVLTNYDLSAGNLSGWTLTTADSNGGIYANQDPVYVATNLVGIGNTGSVRQNITVETGKKYIVGYFCSRRSQSAYRLGIYFSHVGGSITFDESVNAGETKLYYWTSDYTGTTTLQFRGRGGGDGEFSNFIFDEVEEDRSVNGNGLQVFGTIQKNPVATGADLVAYSGHSSSNYLVQPYNADMNVGTGDFTIMCWIKESDATNNTYMFDRNGSSTSQRLAFYMNSSEQLGCIVGNTARVATNRSLPLNVWNLACVKRVGGMLHFGLNGEFYYNDTATNNITGVGDGSEKAYIGSYFGTTDQNAAQHVALFRFSTTAVSDTQFAKIYEDEKFLFQENAQATLYGSSDAVTALAYDDDTELLHVGTSAGRSVFQGLRRIENTTDAVSTAISVNNGMVAEQ